MSHCDWGPASTCTPIRDVSFCGRLGQPQRPLRKCLPSTKVAACLQMRKAVYAFHDNKYATCLEMLQRMLPAMRLDIHLAPHVDTLYKEVGFWLHRQRLWQCEVLRHQPVWGGSLCGSR